MIFLMLDIISKDVGYTGDGDRSSKGKIFFIGDLPKKVAEIETRIVNEDEVNDLPVEGLKSSPRILLVFGLNWKYH